ncbi:response regulator [Pseudodesulfovibrio sp. JC047]|uniref:response regulator n=1 Tax=Pseudodesulfovibrio sp. JC047 TaxID=2683199 RepID=UPI0013D063DD|nr:response regulator [Pseudodesulfovibrio sp. JC047]NDV19574.1 response regulator [Pseudodesulfovibrio sp. JC047]
MSRSAENSTESTLPSSPSTILIAEDSESNAMLFSLYFKGTKYILDFAQNGKQAVDKFKSTTYDLVLMDILMPVMDGWQATEAIRSYETEKGLSPSPIVAVTANTFEEDRQKSLNAGCTDFLPKPVRKAALLDCVARLTHRSP